MKVTVIFEEGALHLSLIPETESERRMVGAVIDQPTGQQAVPELDTALLKATISYAGHFTNKSVERLRLSVRRASRE